MSPKIERMIAFSSPRQLTKCNEQRRVSVTLAVMKLPRLNPVRQFNRTRRWILAGLGLSFVTIGLLGLFLMHDPDRSIAIEIYDAVQPGMTEAEVRRIFDSKQQSDRELYSVVPALCCDIGPRFFVVVAFDGSGTVWSKTIRERPTKMSTSSRVFHELLKSLGMPIEPLNRTWKKP